MYLVIKEEKSLEKAISCRAREGRNLKIRGTEEGLEDSSRNNISNDGKVVTEHNSPRHKPQTEELCCL